MGSPRKLRKKFSKPAHPWQKERLEQERGFFKEYGFKNKKELWKMNSKLRNFSDQSKKLIALKTTQAEKEKKQLLNKLQGLGLVKKTAELEDVLGLTLRDICERRLQTLVFRKGLAHSIKQARQFIVHEHITIAGKKITVPSYLVSKKEEDTIGYAPDSSLMSEDHPERKAKQEKAQQKPRRKVVRPVRRKK